MTELHYSDARDERRKDTGEIFTPDWLVDKMMDAVGDENYWNNFITNDEYCIDSTCGSGQMLLGYARRGVKLKHILGVDLMEDNIITTKKRLREFFKDKMDQKDIEYHLERNIICADALTYHYQFWWYEDPEKITDVLF